MGNTTNYNLIKPTDDDFYDVEDFNINAEIIDAALTPEVNPALVPESDAPSKLVNWLSWFANRIKAITGKSDWKTAPRTTLENAVKLNGDSMTGLLHIEQNGVYPWFDWQTNGVDGNSLGTVFPTGISMSHYPLSTGMPEAQCTIMTVKRSENYMYQEAHRRGTPHKVWSRNYYNGWSPWVEVITSAGGTMTGNLFSPNTVHHKGNLSATDLNAVTEIGFYHLATNCTNLPIPGYNGYLTVAPHAVGLNTYILQTVYVWSGIPDVMKHFSRVMINGEWRAWREYARAEVPAQLTINTLASGFTGSIAYDKNELGLVTLRLNITKDADFAAGVSITIATLPVGYRPNLTHCCFAQVRTTAGGLVKDAYGEVFVDTTGNVRFRGITGGTFTGARLLLENIIAFTARG